MQSKEHSIFVSPSKKDITLIFPCFNESRRLEKTGRELKHYFGDPAARMRIVFVDDGSSDETRQHLEKLCSELREITGEDRFEVVGYTPNRGKGYALREGINASKTDWCLTIDADLSSGPAELDYWLEAGFLKAEEEQVYIASRELGIRQGLVHFSLFRRNVGLIFNKLVRLFTRLPFQDTQCGFKLYPTAAARSAFEDLMDYGFAHDVEVLLKLRKMGFKIQPLPIHWKPEEGSKVNMVMDSLRMLRTIWKLRYS